MTQYYNFQPIDDDDQLVEFLPDYSDSEDDEMYRIAARSEKARLSTVYRVAPDFENLRQKHRSGSKTKLTEELSRAKSDGVLFEQSDSAEYQGKGS